MKKEKSSAAWIMQWAGKQKILYALSIVLAVFNVLFKLIPFFIIGDVINRLINGEKDLKTYLIEIAMIAGSFVIAEIFHSVSTAFSHKATFSVLGQIRKETCDKLSRVPLGYVKDTSSGTLKNIMVERIDSIETTLAHILPEFTSNIIPPIVVLVYLFIIDWRMALLSLVTVVLGFISTFGMFIGYEENYKNAVTKTKALNNAAVEYINGIEVIKVFGKADSSYEKFTKAAKEGADAYINWMRKCCNYHCISFSLTPYTLLTVLPFGAVFIMNGTLTVANFIMCIILALSIVAPLIAVMSYTDDLGKIGTVVGEVAGILEQKELDRPEKSKKKTYDYSIRLKDVCFGYHDKEVLHNINMCMDSGSVNAIVGPSGSGKSTIAKLIASLWDTDSGSIEIGGVNIRDLSLEEYNKSVAYVAQDNYLFNETVRENIRQGNLNATDKEVEQAARLSGCYDFIMSLENGFDTVAGGAGGHLSGGERQRISIARAMLKNAPIVILDEATAYTDPENEAVIQLSVAKLVAGKTLIVIAHRLSTITDADRIFVIDDGRVCEQGTHKELLEDNGLYKQMWQAHISVKDNGGNINA